MDNFTIDAFSPQEDEFALLALGVPSVYRAFFDPRRLAELAYWLEPDAWGRNRPEGWMATWRGFLAGVAGGEQRRLVLKSPNHVFRIPALIDAFPDASYVWIVRDPAEVFFSNRKMWSSMFQHYALWDWNALDLDKFLLQAFESAARCVNYAVRKLPTDCLAVVDFSRLTCAPVATLDAVNDRLRICDWDIWKSAMSEAAAGKAGYRADVYDEQELPPMVLAALDLLRAAQRSALASHGV